MRVVLETGFACKVLPADGDSYYLKTANGTSNRRQIKVYSSPAYATKAANYYPLPPDWVVKIYPVEVSVEVPDGPAPF